MNPVQLENGRFAIELSPGDMLGIGVANSTVTFPTAREAEQQIALTKSWSVFHNEDARAIREENNSQRQQIEMLKRNIDLLLAAKAASEKEVAFLKRKLRAKAKQLSHPVATKRQFALMDMSHD